MKTKKKIKNSRERERKGIERQRERSRELMKRRKREKGKDMDEWGGIDWTREAKEAYGTNLWEVLMKMIEWVDMLVGVYPSLFFKMAGDDRCCPAIFKIVRFR